MIILSSPAKTFNWKRTLPKIEFTQPRFVKEANMIARSLRLYSMRGLGDVLEVSDSLAEVNYERYKKWNKVHTIENSRPALYAYYGDVFQELEPGSYSKKEIDYADRSLRIISGLYGILSATDLIQPYRCEMTLSIHIGTSPDLYHFWKDKVTKALNEDIKKGKHELVLNLASKEYSKVIDFAALDAPSINVDFKQDVKGRIKNYGLLSKRARGEMLDYCLRNQAETLDDLKKFDVDGYKLDRETKNVIGFVKDAEEEEVIASTQNDKSEE